METEVGTDIHGAARLLENGHLVAIPTETVYGLAGNALSKNTLAQIFEVKQRPTFDPLILHVDKLDKLRHYVQGLPDPFERLANYCMPGPLTFVLPKTAQIPDLATAGRDTVAIRIPDNTLTLELLALLDFPLAAPSANPFMYVSPTTADHVQQQLGGFIPYILDSGPADIGIESTIITPAEGNGLQVLRLGGTSIETLQEHVEPVKLPQKLSDQPQAPGQMQSHYAPQTLVKIGKPDEFFSTYNVQEIGFISFHTLNKKIPEANQVVLSQKGSLREAAQNLFAALRTLDRTDLTLVVAESFPEEGLGRAINDRLKRAASVV